MLLMGLPSIKLGLLTIVVSCTNKSETSEEGGRFLYDEEVTCGKEGLVSTRFSLGIPLNEISCSGKLLWLGGLWGGKESSDVVEVWSVPFPLVTPIKETSGSGKLLGFGGLSTSMVESLDIGEGGIPFPAVTPTKETTGSGVRE